VFQDCIREAKDAGRTVLLSSHILAQVEVLADRVSIIRQGAIVESGTLADLRQLARTTIRADVAKPAASIGELRGVHDLSEEAGTVRFEVDPDSLDEVLRALASLGVSSLVAHPPTLEQLLLRHYGVDDDPAATGEAVSAEAGAR
jgi:ABC-2 type transport system ATP-binding protein